MFIEAANPASAVSTERQKVKSRHYMPFLTGRKKFFVGERKSEFPKTGNFKGVLRKLG